VSFRRTALGLAVALLSLAWTSSALASASGVVISEFRFRGPAGGNDEFVELFNTASDPVDVSGWRLQGCSSTTGVASARATIPANVTLASGEHYLFANTAAGGYSGTVPPDQAYATGITDGAGVRIVDAALNFVDGVSGTLTAGSECREGMGIAGMPSTNGDNAYERKLNGTLDTDNNANDFVGPKPSNPQNRSNTDPAPHVVATSPADGAADIPVDARLTVTFSEAVAVSGAWYTISCSSSGTHTAAVSGGPSTFTLDPDTDFVPSETCTITVVAGGVSDLDANDPPDHMLANFTFTIATEAPPVPIHEIQGAGHTSPKDGQPVARVPGIVTQKLANGFFLQDPVPDDDPATSEGIFVFGSISAGLVEVGDAVTVNGRAQEFFGSGSSAATNLSVTEIAFPTVKILSHGNPLPAPVRLAPPGEVIDNDSFALFDPAEDGIDYYESLEGMRVEVDDATAVGPTKSFASSNTNELPVVQAGAGVRTPRGGIIVAPGDFNPERVFLQTPLGGLPAANVGDTIPGATVGALDYNFGNFKLRPAGLVNVVAGPLQPETTAAASGPQISVATFNVENLDPSDGPTKFERLAHILVTNLAAPDLVALEEVQDNNGPVDDGTVAANVTLDTLVAAIAAAGGPEYEYRLIDPENDADGGEPGGNIRVAFLFRTDRGLAFDDRPGATATTPNALVGTSGGIHLQYNPGRLDPTNEAAFHDSRKPLAGEFTYRGHELFVIANHFNSKGGDQPLFGRFQPPARSSEEQRHLQAQVVRDFAAGLLSADPRANVVVLGDLNDFEFSDTVSILESAGLQALIETLPKPERYTYVFDGNSQAIDHILVGGNLFDHAALEYDVVHVNAEFADQASDHDPQVVRLSLPAASLAGVRSNTPNANGWNNAPVTVEFTCLDPLSSIAACPDPVTVDAEGANQTVTRAVTTKGGLELTASVTGISVDRTPPAVGYTGATDYTVDETVAVDCAAGDAVSGLETASCADVDGPAYKFGLGAHPYTASATDRAGNEATANVNVNVSVTAPSLCRLTTTFLQKQGIANSLCVKLQAGSYAAYAHEVRAQSGKALSADEAQVLSGLVDALPKLG
jgi:hypothetical protein